MANPKGMNRISVELDTTANVVRMTFIDRETENIVATYEAPASKVHTSLRSQVFLYGLNKLITDRSSQLSSASAKDRITAFDETMANLEKGAWAADRKSGGPTVSAEVQALAEIKKVPVSAIQATLRTLDADTKKKVLENVAAKYPDVVAKYANSEAEVDLADLT